MFFGHGICVCPDYLIFSMTGEGPPTIVALSSPKSDSHDKRVHFAVDSAKKKLRKLSLLYLSGGQGDGTWYFQ